MLRLSCVTPFYIFHARINQNFILITFSHFSFADPARIRIQPAEKSSPRPDSSTNSLEALNFSRPRPQSASFIKHPQNTGRLKHASQPKRDERGKLMYHLQNGLKASMRVTMLSHFSVFPFCHGAHAPRTSWNSGVNFHKLKVSRARISIYGLPSH